MLSDPPGEGASRAARHLGDRLTRLARVTAELATADTVDAVTKIVITHSADAVGATMASLTLLDGPATLRLVGLRGGDEGEAEQWASFPLDSRTPVSDVVRTGRRLVLSGAAEIAERYPESDRGERSIVCLPLRVSTRTIGAIGLSFPAARFVDSAELEFFEILADTCAQALERVGAQEEAAKQTAKLVFLADAATELSSSLDYQTTLARVARLAVPTFADWCAIDLVEDGRLNRLAVEHVDPAKVQLAIDLEQRYPADPDAPSGAWNVMRTGRSELVREVTDEMLVAAAIDDEHLRIARELRLRSGLTVPLVARGRVLGVITWVSAESDRLYGPDDLALAEDLAKRAAIAIDNAELHSQTLAAADQLQHAVLPESLPAVPGWELASYYGPSGRTEVGGDFYDAIPLSDGRLVLFVGDVMGRGVGAAAAMAQMRAAVRAYAALDPAPATVTSRLDLMFAQYPTEQLVTLVYMVADPTRGELVVANAGHPPPVLLRRDGRSEPLPLASGPPLGIAEQPRQELTVPLERGDTLVAFTDGLIERRDEDIDRGQQRMDEAMTRLTGTDLSVALHELVAELRDASRDDDVAALAVRRGEPPTSPDRPA
ncbi:GAF domain-containing SpoIIE family protein phosphatase [Oryzihumus sp.]|uniref:GAF domain-containing SpoIIE family protein phosphatase n=1 Tax=Oryzihumus sp. TaxID=1968903 RepID=UPI002ED962D5